MKKVSRKESSRIQRELGSKVTEKVLEKELYRFCTMDTKQLLNRIKKIKNPVKAEACRTMAKWLGLKKVVKAARIRRNELAIA